MAGVRQASIIEIPPENTVRYEELHRDVPPAVLKAITDANIVNYSIFRYHEQLFSYFEYVGENYEDDMEKMAADPAVQEWWAICKPLQRQTADNMEGAWWTPITEVFHVD